MMLYSLRYLTSEAPAGAPFRGAGRAARDTAGSGAGTVLSNPAHLGSAMSFVPRFVG
jgi:hypothetical protein